MRWDREKKVLWATCLICLVVLMEFGMAFELERGSRSVNRHVLSLYSSFCPFKETRMNK